MPQDEEREVFRKIRQGHRIQQSELAKKAKIYRTKLSEWENGHVELSEDERQRLGNAMDLLLKQRGVPDEIVDSREGSVVYRERQREFITQAELAKRAGLSQSTISLFEKSRVDLPPAQVKKIFQALDSLSREKKASFAKLRAQRKLAMQRASRIVSLASLRDERPEQKFEREIAAVRRAVNDLKQAIKNYADTDFELSKLYLHVWREYQREGLSEMQRQVQRDSMKVVLADIERLEKKKKAAADVLNQRQNILELLTGSHGPEEEPNGSPANLTEEKVNA